jgi:hypothetical protein
VSYGLRMLSETRNIGHARNDSRGRDCRAS